MDTNASKVLEETIMGPNAFVRQLYFDLDDAAPVEVAEPEQPRQWVPSDFNKRVTGKTSINDAISRLITSIATKGFDHVNPDGYMLSCELLPKAKDRRVVFNAKGHTVLRDAFCKMGPATLSKAEP